MNNVWGKTALALTLALSTASVYAGSVWADPAAEQISAATTPAYQQLTDSLKVQVKSVLNERTSDSVKIAVVVRMKNESGVAKRVPDYELRAKTQDGTEYTLLPSSGNVRSVLAKSETELSYLIKLDNKEAVHLSELQWIDVDWNVYPKTETAILSVPIQGQSWAGSDAVIQDPAAMKKWGESFTLPSSNLPLTYTPIDISKQYKGAKTVYVVKLQVENTGTANETVPNLILEGKDSAASFQGPRVEQGDVKLEPKEKKYVHFAIETEKDSVLKSINVLTPESFVQTDAKGQTVSVGYTVGRIQIVLPEAGLPAQFQPVDYTAKTSIAFDPLNKIINSDVDVSLIELTMHESQGVGYKTAIAKFKLTNKGQTPLPVPAFGAELATQQGLSYAGSRSVGAPKQLMPKLTQVVSYAFIVPNSEQGDHLVLKLSDNDTAAPFKSTIAALNVAVQPLAQQGDVLSFYPFEVQVKDWTILATTNVPTAANPTVSYGYRLKMILDVKQTDDVVVDQDFSKMKVALVDSLGRKVAEQNLSFTQSGGINQLVSGELNVRFENIRAEQQDNNMKLQIYEAIPTEFGEAKRLVAEYK